MSNNDIEYKTNKMIDDISNDVKIIKSKDGSVYKFEKDKLNYVRKTLDNGLRIMFIEDDLAVASEVHMSVDAGHQHNPPGFDGLAHFLEHMLFIGSKKYPDSDTYNRLVTQAHGISNAYTADDHTVYYFTCQCERIFKILDVFCQFFVEPLLDPKYVDKEISAVDHEHKKNLASDMYRKWSLVDRFLTDNVNTRFRTGDRSTLKKDGVIDALRSFYNTYYTVDRMLLVIVHNKVDDKFIDSVSEVFSGIPSRRSGISIESEIFPVGLRKVNGYEIIRARKMSDGHELMIRFFLPGTIKNRKLIDKGFHILSYLLNHRGRRSLYNLLVELKLIRSMFSSIGMVYTKETGYDMMIILTDYGFENYQSIILIILAYMNKIRMRSDRIFDRYFDEMHEIDMMNLNTMSRIRGSDVVEGVIDLHVTYRPKLKYTRIFDILEDVNSIRRHFIDMMNTIIEQLDLRMKVILMSHMIEDVENGEIDTHYGTRYLKTVEKFDPLLIQQFYEKDYKMPEMNPYIPKSIESIVPIPGEKFNSIRSDDMLLVDDPEEFIRLGSDRDNFYHLLKHNDFESNYAYGSFTVYLSSLAGTLNPIDFLILEFYIQLVRDAHKPDIYMSSIAGSNVSLSSSLRGIKINFRSFDSSLNDLFETYLKWFFNERLEIDRTAYYRIYVSIRDYLVNYERSEPYTRLYQSLVEYVAPEETISNSQLLYAIQAFDPETMENENSQINFTNLQDKALELMRKGSVRGVMAGSLHLGTAQKIVKFIDSIFEHEREFKIRRIKNPVLNNNQEDVDGYTERVHTIQNKNEEDKNIGVCYAIHLGEFVRSEYDADKAPEQIRDLMAYLSISSTLRDRFFNTMRTENELGYYVRAGVISVDSAGVGNLFLKFEIQTQENGIDNIIREYVDKEVIKIVREFNQEDLQSFAQNILEQMFAEPANMSDKFGMAESIQSNLTYDELENIGKSTFLNRLRSIDVMRETRKLTLDYIHKLIENALQNRPRYLIKIVPKS